MSAPAAPRHSDAAVLALLEGQRFAVQLAYSAVLSGTAFVACCRACGVNPASLPAQRRQDIDAQMARHAAAGGLQAPSEAAALLVHLLQQRLH